MSEYISLSGISYAYPGSSLPVFDDLDLSFSSGWTVLAGANGAGKTTLSRLISGELAPDHGRVSVSGEIVTCPQVFTGLRYDDCCYIYDGTAETGKLRSCLSISDDMLAEPSVLSGGEKKRLQLLAALSRRPGILILDEPTNHLDQESRDLVISALKDFEGCGIMITHDRSTAAAISSRTIFLERIMEKPAKLYDIPLPLSEALDEIDRRKRDGRNAYDSLSAEIASLSFVSDRLGEKSRGMHGRLSKAGLDIHDHSGKAAIDGARLTGKDRSIEDQRRRILAHARHKEEKLAGMEKPLMRKEGIDLQAGGYIPYVSFGPAVLSAGDYTLSVPSLALSPGSHVAVTGRNGSGKTLLVKAIVAKICQEGKGRHLLYIPQEYADDERERLLQRVRTLSDEEKGMILSDIYRMGSDPSFLLEGNPEPSPGELKKLDFILSRYDGRNIIVMDEPTNHLDIVSMMILEKIMDRSNRSFSLLLVSHDSAFTGLTCSTVWEISRKGNEGTVRILS